MDTIHVGDIGTKIVLTLTQGASTTPFDISTASSLQLVFQLPDQSVFSRTAVFSTNGHDGSLQYISQVGDFSQSGRWQVQAVVILPAGTWHSDVVVFKVAANLT